MIPCETKNWSLTAIAELADKLAREKAIRVVLLGTADDRPGVLDLLKKTNAKPIDAVGKTDISRLISLIKRCNALVTGDSAPMHVAAATKTPFVAIFGPTDPERHLPPAEKNITLFKQMNCAPCYKPVCLKHVKCMTSVKPEEVFEALMEILEMQN